MTQVVLGSAGRIEHLEAGCGNLMACHELLGEHLGRFDLGSGKGGPEHPVTLLLQLVRQPHGQGFLGADHRQVNLVPAHPSQDRGRIVHVQIRAVSVAGDAGIARCTPYAFHIGTATDRANERVFPPAAADNQNIQGGPPATDAGILSDGATRRKSAAEVQARATACQGSHHPGNIPG